jgi:hypothetical protein
VRARGMDRRMQSAAAIRSGMVMVVSLSGSRHRLLVHF